MVNKIFKSILLVAIAVLLASLIIITAVLYHYFSNMQKALLKDELNFTAAAAQTLGVDYLKQLDSTRYRLTWISHDGRVIYDSHLDDTSMENHREGEENRKAVYGSKKNSLHQSSTLTDQTIYESIPLEDGSILRISISRATALVLVLGILPPTTVVLILSIGLSTWLARRMANRVVAPLNNLDLEHPLENEVYEELSPLLYRIYTQHLKLKENIETLQYKQREFDEITTHMKETLILLDNNGKILSMNSAAKRLFDLESSPIGEDFLTIERKQHIRAAMEEAMCKGHASIHTQKNGREYQLDLTRITSFEKNYGMVILAFDITEQLYAEKHRREFTANVSHELKTPLQSIIGSSELIKNGVVKEDDLPRFIEHIHSEATRLVILIEDIIRLSQLDEGLELPSEALSLNAIAKEVLENLSPMAKKKNISTLLTGDEGKLQGIHRLLYEILYNLCDNAIKYTPPGGSVTVDITRQETEILLTVTDTGMGIPIEHHDKIFERFYRVDKSHSKESGGTGLGLSIVKHAVQYHRGTIAVDSTPGKGTAISIRFPFHS